MTVLAVALLRRLVLPSILAYLAVGTLLGPAALGWLADSETMRFLGEVGVAFLLFAIGLEFSLPQFWAMRRILLGLGGVQVVAGTASGAAIAWFLGIPWQAALVVGGALAMSSTAIVVKQLTEQGELQVPHGRLALGILLFQDLAAVPFLVIIPILAGGSDSDATIAGSLLLALLKGVGAFAAMLVLGRWLLRPLFQEVASARSAELFTLNVLLVSLLAAWITHGLGLSLALGAFLSGMMLAETEYRHQIESDIRPFRDVLLGLFFVTVGMQLDLKLLPPLWPWIGLLVAGLVIGKGILIAALAYLTGLGGQAALRAGVVLGHGGEFGFALLLLALSTGLLDATASQPILAAVVVSMLLAPLLVRHNGVLAQAVLPKTPSSDRPVRDLAQALNTTRDHVVICGYGRVGQHAAGLLESEGIAYVGLDLDPQRIKAAWEDGKAVFFGDACRSDILNAAGVQRARALLISFDDPPSALKILHHTRAANADLPVLVRVRDDTYLDRLRSAGANDVISETFEAGLTLSERLLALLAMPPDSDPQRLRAERQNRCRSG